MRNKIVIEFLASLLALNVTHEAIIIEQTFKSMISGTGSKFVNWHEKWVLLKTLVVKHQIYLILLVAFMPLLPAANVTIYVNLEMQTRF